MITPPAGINCRRCSDRPGKRHGGRSARTGLPPDPEWRDQEMAAEVQGAVKFYDAGKGFGCRARRRRPGGVRPFQRAQPVGHRRTATRAARQRLGGEGRARPRGEGARADLVRQANWQKVGGASPPERRSNRTTFLREPCVGSREGAGEASVAAWMGRAIEHRKSDGPGCRGFQIGRRQYRRRRFGEMSASPAVSENPCTFARLLLGPWEVFKLPRLS